MHRAAVGSLRRGGERIGCARDAEIVAMHMRRMRHAERLDCLVQRHQDGARGDAVGGNHVVEIEVADVLLERGGAARIDDLHAEAARHVEHQADIVADRLRALAASQEVEKEGIVAEHHEAGAIDDRDVLELEMRSQREKRRNRRLHDSRETHLGIETSRLDGGPAGRRKRRIGRRARFADAQFRKEESRDADIAARDMGVHVDGARHDDLAGEIVCGVGRFARARLIDMAVANIDVADRIAAACRIDDPTVREPDQHRSSLLATRASIFCTTSAAVARSLRADAATCARLPARGLNIAAS